jgi:hypothetical protein
MTAIKLKEPIVRTNGRMHFGWRDVFVTNGWKEGTVLASVASKGLPFGRLRVRCICNDYVVVTRMDGASMGQSFTLSSDFDFREVDDTPEPVAEPVKKGWPEGVKTGTLIFSAPGVFGKVEFNDCPNAKTIADAIADSAKVMTDFISPKGVAK